MRNIFLAAVVVFLFSFRIYSQTDCADIVLDVPQTTFCSNSLVGAVNISVLVDGTVPATGASEYTGDGITQTGDATAVFNSSSLPSGTYTATYTYTSPTDGCVSTETIDFMVVDVPLPSLMPDMLQVCEGEIVTIDHTGSTGNEIWDIDGADLDNLTATTRELAWNAAGLYRVSLTYAVPGCDPEVAEVMIEVTSPPSVPMITCEQSGIDFILFGWNDQTNFMYEVFIDNVSVGIQSQSSYLAENLNDGQQVDIRVVVLDPICGDVEATGMCTSSPCNLVWNIDIPTETVFCSPEDFPLEFNVSGFDPFDSANVIDAEWQNPEFSGNLFTPTPGVQDYRLVARYINGPCMRDTVFDITVYETPTFTLQADPNPVCVGSSAVISYDYDISNGEMLIWDFGSGVEGTAGTGTQEVFFNDVGPQTVTLQIDNNGCLSDVVPIIIDVEPELIPPTIMCGASTITTAEFTWDSVDCAGSYDIFIDGVFETTQTDLSYTVENLLSETMVELTVVANSICACDNVMTSFTCMSEPCPAEIFDFSRDPAETVCIVANATTFTITATPTTLAGTGTGSWSTTAPQNFINADGTIDPSLAVAGTYDLIYDYQEDVCNFSPMTTITFVDPPQVSVVDISDPKCPDDILGSIEVEAIGGLSPYTYTVDGGAEQNNGIFSDLNIGSHEIQITDSNGCVSAVEVLNIAPPVVPTALITGNTVVFLDTDGTYELNFNETLDAADIDNILWFNNGVVVNEGPAALNYTYGSADQDAVLIAAITYNDDCVVETDSLFVDVRQIQSTNIPNIINPRFASDPINAEWRASVKGDEEFPQNLRIYNRWGNLVHEVEWNFNASNRPPVGDGALLLWDGFYGADGPDIVGGVYAYVMEIEREGELRTVAGTLTIIR